MLLESSLILINIFSKNLFIMLFLTMFLMIMNFKYNKNFLLRLKKIVKFLLIYLFYCIVSVIFIKNGVILIQIGKFYITEEGLKISLEKFLRLSNFLLISILISVKYKNYKLNIKHPRLEKLKLYYKDVFRLIFDTVPYTLDLVRQRVKFTEVYRKILIKVYRNL